MAGMYRTVTVMVSLLLATLASGHSDTTSVHLTKDNFQTEVDGANYFVMFYAPWCDYCKKLAPTWASLAEARNGAADGLVKIGRVDCTTDGDLCTQHDITGYPMLKLFRKGASGGDSGTKYRGNRDLAQFNAFLDEQLASAAGEGAKDGEDGSQEDGGMPDAPPAPVSPLTELTEDTFAKHVSSGKHFVKFYAPWCGHCTKLAPTWEELARSLEHERDIRVSKIDCTQYRPICTDFEVKGYPTLLWIEDGKKIEKYTGPRTHADLKQYVSRMAGGLKEEQDADQQQGDKKKEEGTLEGGAERDDNRSVVVQLSEGDFTHAIAKGVTVVKFYAPWCGHCMRLAPTWEQLAEKLAARDDVKIAKVDCTVDANKELCGEQEVNGYPTIFLYREGEKVTEYFGHRSLDDLHEFVMQHLQDQGGSHDEL
uniref:Thioredoxin domain-containing protein n=1 Tax=Anopheles maculatus TaxID=74869 RepID=A0A182SEZ7_9DIPT